MNVFYEVRIPKSSQENPLLLSAQLCHYSVQPRRNCSLTCNSKSLNATCFLRRGLYSFCQNFIGMHMAQERFRNTNIKTRKFVVRQQWIQIKDRFLNVLKQKVCNEILVVQILRWNINVQNQELCSPYSQTHARSKYLQASGWCIVAELWRVA